MDGKFTFTANGQRHEAGIAWDSKTERYEVRAPTLKAMSFVEPGDRREVVSYLNSRSRPSVSCPRPSSPSTPTGSSSSRSYRSPAPERFSYSTY